MVGTAPARARTSSTAGEYVAISIAVTVALRFGPAPWRSIHTYQSPPVTNREPSA